MTISEIRRLRTEVELLKIFSNQNTGIKKSFVRECKDEFADRKANPFINYYYYTGPLDEKTRPFCRKMLLMDKVFSEDEINIISNKLNYDVLVYMGSYNCRHEWVKFSGKIITTTKPTNRQLGDLGRIGIKNK